MSKEITISLTEEDNLFWVTTMGEKDSAGYSFKTLPAAYDFIEKIKSILALVNVSCEITMSTRLEPMYKAYSAYSLQLGLHNLAKTL